MMMQRLKIEEGGGSKKERKTIEARRKEELENVGDGRHKGWRQMRNEERGRIWKERRKKSRNGGEKDDRNEGWREGASNDQRKKRRGEKKP